MPTEDIFKVVNHHDYDDNDDDNDNLDAQEAQRQRPASLSVKKPSFLRSASGGAADDGFDGDYDDGDYYHYQDDDEAVVHLPLSLLTPPNLSLLPPLIRRFCSHQRALLPPTN